ncbi:hypothetical protein BHE74_00020607 [Ensete ventricosum]|nr:hypothetical protein BHE74_00020607 [Ensete ventricosum]
MIGAVGELDYFSAHIRLREPDKSKDKAEGGTSVESSIPCSHGGRALVVKQAKEVENAEANSKYEDKAEGRIFGFVDVFRSKLSKSTMDPWNPFASVTMGEEPFNFLRALCVFWLIWITSTAGAIGGVAASLIRVPTEVVKQRMQTGQFTSAPNAVHHIVAKEGIRGLYAGYSSFLLRDLPFDAIQFCIYEQLRSGYKIAAGRELSDPENAVIGAFAGRRPCRLVLLSPLGIRGLRAVREERARMSGSEVKKVAEVAAKATTSIDWDGMNKLLVSEEARKEFTNLRRAFDEVNHQLQTKLSQVYYPPSIANHARSGVLPLLVRQFLLLSACFHLCVVFDALNIQQ